MPILSALFTYPIKSCRGISHSRVLLTHLGLAWDRHWMVTDADGRFVSQREYAGMARIVPALTETHLQIDAPNMPPFHIALNRGEVVVHRKVTIWRDGVVAIDEGEAAARWFSDAIGANVRLVRFDESSLRRVDPGWTAEESAFTQFADGFPVLVTSEASLAELNGRLAAKGAPEIQMDRFRPNMVLSELDAYDEDFVDSITIAGNGGPVLRLVKPCARCPIPTIDQTSGLRNDMWPNEPLDTMSLYRANRRVDGGLTFGQNAIILQGEGTWLQTGDQVHAEWHFAEDD